MNIPVSEIIHGDAARPSALSWRRTDTAREKSSINTAPP